MKRILRVTIFLFALAATFVSCGRKDSVTLDFPFKDSSFPLTYESVSQEDKTTNIKLEREYSFADADFLPQLQPYKNETDLALYVWEQKFRVTRKVGAASGIKDILLIASVDGSEIARWGTDEDEILGFSSSVADEAYASFAGALFNAVVTERKIVKVVFTGTMLEYEVAEADRQKVLATFDFQQYMLAKITIKR